MVERLGWLGSDVALIIIGAVIFVGAVASGLIVAEKSKSAAAGWAVGLCCFVLLALVFGPTIEAIQRV